MKFKKNNLKDDFAFPYSIKRKIKIFKEYFLIAWYSLATSVAVWLFFNIGLARRENLPNEAAYQINWWIWNILYDEGGRLSLSVSYHKWQLEKILHYLS